MKLRHTILLLVLLLIPAGIISAADSIPLPTFSNYEIPSTQNPTPRSEWRDYLDVVALAVALSLASFFAIKTRSRRSIFLLTIASLVWFGFWRTGCICPIGAIQNVTLAAFDPSYIVPLSALAFFLLPLVFTLFFGRTFCSSVCPLGAVQELVTIRPVQTPAWLDHALGLLAYIYLGLAVLFAATGTAFVICRYDPFVGLFRLNASVNMLLLAACFLILGMFVGRPYCRYLCPYGAILGVLSKLSKWHVTIPPDRCIQCRLCEEACPYGAIREPTIIPPANQRPSSRRRLVAMLLLTPVLIALGAILGRNLDAPMAWLHPTVRLAEHIRLEEKGQLHLTSPENDNLIHEIDAFRNTGRSVEELYREATSLRASFRVASAWFGAWVGLVISIKLIQLSIRRRRTEYVPDRAGCVSCGRCFWYCPVK